MLLIHLPGKTLSAMFFVDVQAEREKKEAVKKHKSICVMYA